MLELFIVQRNYKSKIFILISFCVIQSPADVVLVPSHLNNYRNRIDASVDEQRKYRQVLESLSNKASQVQSYHMLNHQA